MTSTYVSGPGRLLLRILEVIVIVMADMPPPMVSSLTARKPSRGQPLSKQPVKTLFSSAARRARQAE
ncbi:hypothetical protein ACWD4O_11930 [Streptomyces sp. NPDC002623]|uniref:hypothetical protein n=1 Tax=Streptomyces sp. NPDC000618 TaxID=3154265 RepID=UPI003328B348